MTRRLISTNSHFEKEGAFSRVVVDGDFAFVSGTTGYDFTTMELPEDITGQTRNCFKTIEKALKDAGFAMADVVRVTYYLTDRNEIDAFAKVAREYFETVRPAAMMVITQLADPKMKVEIVTTAKRRTA